MRLFLLLLPLLLGACGVGSNDVCHDVNNPCPDGQYCGYNAECHDPCSLSNPCPDRLGCKQGRCAVPCTQFGGVGYCYAAGYSCVQGFCQKN